MHKLRLTILFLFSAFQLFSQSLDSINSLEEAENFMKNNPNLRFETSSFVTTKDSIDYYKKVFLKEDFKKNNCVVEMQNTSSMRVNYIYLDGSKLSLKEINKRRELILGKLKKGISFAILAKEFTMDGSDGDLGWFDDGVMHLTFETEIKKHKKGDIFTVDIPENNWYYVVEKTYEDIPKVKFYILTVLD